MNFKDLKIGQKIISGYIFICLIALIIGIAGITAMENMDDSFNTVTNKSLPSVYFVGEMGNSITQIYESFWDLSNPDLTRFQREKLIQDIDSFRMDLDTIMEQFSRLDTSEEEEKVYEQLTKDIIEWRKIDQQIIDLNTAFMKLGLLQPIITKKQIEEFKNDHYELLLNVLHFIENKKQITLVKSSQNCHWAKWLTSFDKSDTILSSLLKPLIPYHNNFHNAVSQIKRLLNNGNYQEAKIYYYNKIVPVSQKFFKSFNLIDTEITKSQNLLDQIISITDHEMEKKYKEFFLHFSKLKKINTKDAQSEKRKGTQTFHSNMLLIIVTIIAGILFSIFLSITITRSITTGLRQGVSLAQKIAEGNLLVDLSSKILNQKDEVGQLACALQNMVGQLKKIISNIMNSSENFSIASQEMSFSSQQLSQGASEQASSAEEIASSMEEMIANIQQNTENALQTQNIATSAAEEIRKANQKCQSTGEAMKTIASNVTIIEEIAFKTNILSLNAAVEAAHAGEQAQGFSVIANEIGKLAEKTRSASIQITKLAKLGVETSNKATKQLASVVPNIEKTSNLVQEIAASSLEQKSGADQINSAMQQLNNVIQKNAAASEELASASEELSGQAQNMREMVANFKI